MAWLRKIWRLPAPDRFLLLQAIGLLAAIRVGLWLLPLGALRRLLRRATERRTTSGSGEPFSAATTFNFIPCGLGRACALLAGGTIGSL